MTGDLVAPQVNVPDDIRATIRHPPQHKERCGHVVPFEKVKNPPKADVHTDGVSVPVFVSDDVPKGFDAEVVFDIDRQDIQHDVSPTRPSAASHWPSRASHRVPAVRRKTPRGSSG